MLFWHTMTEFIPLPLETHKSRLPFPTRPSGHRAIDWALSRLPDLEKGTELGNKLVELVREKGTKVIVLSPHEDDIPLSVGGLVTEFPAKQVYSVTFFTQALDSANPAAQKRYMEPGFSTVTELYQRRQEEDLKANETLGIPRRNQYHLGFIDAPWRLKNEKNKPVYAGRESQLGRVATADKQNLVPQLTDRLHDVVTEIAGASKNYVILVPAALGITRLQIRPVDHEIIRDVARAAFPATDITDHVVYYGEYPYLSEAVPDKALSRSGKLPALRAVPDQDLKHRAVECHRTQLHRLFNPKSSLSVGDMPKKFPPEMLFIDEKVIHSLSRYPSAV